MKVLIIDDSDYKIEGLKALLNEAIPASDVAVATAFRPGVALARKFLPELILLDMSLPTFEAGGRDSGGRMRPFGGREIMRELDATGHLTKILIVTQFDSFGERNQSREELLTELKAEFGEYIVGGVYYGAVDSKWQEALRQILKTL